jgi:uncharacterized protein (TIGR03000 family)
MYTVVLLAALSTADQAPAHGWKKTHGYGACYGMCYGVGYTGWPHAAGGWGLPYGGYWAGYACHGGCGGYESYAYGMHTPTLSPAPTTYAPVNGKSGDKDKDKDKGDDKDPDNGKKKDKDKDDTENKTQARARVIFELPQGATLYVDEALIARADERRSFRTPVLQKGEQYFYDLRVEVVRDGKKHVESRRITVSAGDVIKADFSSVGKTTGVASAEPR